MSYFAGIDPGKEGAFVTLNESGDIVEAFSFESYSSKQGYDTIRLAKDISHTLTEYKPLVFIEKVHAMPGQGVTSMFSFGFGAGLLAGILSCHDVSWEYVTPQKWKATMTEGLPKDKNISVTVALRLFPDAKDILVGPRGGAKDGIADALLIAEWGRRYVNGQSRPA